MNITAYLLLLACCCCCCGAQLLNIGPPALSQLTVNDRSDVENQILGQGYMGQMMTTHRTGGTGGEAATDSIDAMTIQINRWTTAFKIKTDDVTARTSMFVGCSSGTEGNVVWTGAVRRTWHKCIGRGRQHTIGDNAQCYGIIMFELNVRNVVAGGEVMNGRASLLSPEHTVTIPLSDSDYTFTDTASSRGVNCGGGSSTHAWKAGSSFTSDSTVTAATIRSHLCLCRAATADNLAATTTLWGLAPRARRGRNSSARSAARLVAVVAS